MPLARAFRLLTTFGRWRRGVGAAGRDASEPSCTKCMCVLAGIGIVRCRCASSARRSAAAALVRWARSSSTLIPHPSLAPPRAPHQPCAACAACSCCWPLEPRALEEPTLGTWPTPRPWWTASLRTPRAWSAGSALTFAVRGGGATTQQWQLARGIGAVRPPSAHASSSSSASPIAGKLDCPPFRTKDHTDNYDVR